MPPELVGVQRGRFPIDHLLCDLRVEGPSMPIRIAVLLTSLIRLSIPKNEVPISY